MVHSQGISPSNLFIHFLQRGNLTHDLIHLCDVAEMPAALRDTSCIFGPQINTRSHNRRIATETDKRSSRGRRRGGGGGGSQMLSLAISLSICSRILATLQTDTFYSHMTHVRVKKKYIYTRARNSVQRDFLVGAQPALIHWRGLIGTRRGPIRRPGSEECFAAYRGAPLSPGALAVSRL